MVYCNYLYVLTPVVYRCLPGNSSIKPNAFCWLALHIPLTAFIRRVRKNCEKRQPASSCMPLCLSVGLSIRQRGTARFPLDGFSWNLVLEYFRDMLRHYLTLYWLCIVIYFSTKDESLNYSKHIEDIYWNKLRKKVHLVGSQYANSSDKGCREKARIVFQYFFKKSYLL